ncbi:GNAT family N-acetyltransferase [Enterococcus saccharolyticus]|uniref:N-acetyltransferase domain-containing protein n=1 Tax=Candidatus Enterococcus willemsii TaxID=1857215 RepID=A0ABQ6YXW9_9ENTE|nr:MULTISPECIES: GNAT family N-acetyltransferase [Enterococcus]KAF1302858.1 hypothetical protein BAU17_11620 [Enterococcus sp. CU12B]MCD5000995.1 GNAT family N-acetyltransferase [Enterococcus saccharolyticus]
MLNFVRPSLQYKQQILDYRQIFEETVESMDGSSFLAQMPSVEAWLAVLEKMRKEQPPVELAPSETWLIIDKGTLVGMSNLRFRLCNDYLEAFGGHIGYSVHPNYRKQGYGTQILRATLLEAKKRGMTELLVTCNDNNIGSAKIIEANHGQLEKKVLDTTNQEIIRRYWITL